MERSSRLPTLPTMRQAGAARLGVRELVPAGGEAGVLPDIRTSRTALHPLEGGGQAQATQAGSGTTGQTEELTLLCLALVVSPLPRKIRLLCLLSLPLRAPPPPSLWRCWKRSWLQPSIASLRSEM